MELLYFRKQNFLAPSLKNFERKVSELEKYKKNTLETFLIFPEMELSSPNLRKLLIFEEETCKD